MKTEIYLHSTTSVVSFFFCRFTMGKQNRAIAQKTKVKQQKNDKKPKVVKTNLKRVRFEKKFDSEN